MQLTENELRMLLAITLRMSKPKMAKSVQESVVEDKPAETVSAIPKNRAA